MGTGAVELIEAEIAARRKNINDLDAKIEVINRAASMWLNEIEGLSVALGILQAKEVPLPEEVTRADPALVAALVRSMAEPPDSPSPLIGNAPTRILVDEVEEAGLVPPPVAKDVEDGTATDPAEAKGLPEETLPSRDFELTAGAKDGLYGVTINGTFLEMPVVRAKIILAIHGARPEPAYSDTLIGLCTGNRTAMLSHVRELGVALAPLGLEVRRLPVDGYVLAGDLVAPAPANPPANGDGQDGPSGSNQRLHAALDSLPVTPRTIAETLIAAAGKQVSRADLADKVGVNSQSIYGYISAIRRVLPGKMMVIGCDGGYRLVTE